MADCNHNKTTNKQVSLDYFGLEFSAEMEVCEDCNAHLWTQESREQLNLWLAEQKKVHRDHFTLQVTLSDHVKSCLDEMVKEHPGVPSSVLIRAMTLVFLRLMEEPQHADFFETITDNPSYQSFLHGNKHITKVQFNPSGMLDIHSWAKLLQIKPTKIVEEAVYRITSIHIETDPKLKKFWEDFVLPQISIILKSAS